MAKKKAPEHAAVTLIRALHRNTPGEGFVELRAIPSDKSGSLPIIRDWTQASTDVVSFADEYGHRRSGYGVYMGVCKRLREGGKKADVMSAPALWVDIDTLNNGWDTAATLKEVYTIRGELQPSAIVKSGGGLHCYWFLEDDVRFDADGETRAERVKMVEDANAALAFVMGGDSVQNIDRVMRLPGSWNSKRGISSAKEVEIVYCYPDARKRLDAITSAALSQKKVLAGPDWVTPATAAKLQRTVLGGGKETEQTVQDAIGYALNVGGRRLEQSLDAMWRDRVRYHPARGYMGLDEAVMVTTARLWCKYADTKDAVDRVTLLTLDYVDQLNAKWDGGKWSRETQKEAIRAKILRWAPKWEEIRAAARRAKVRRANDEQRAV